MDKKKIIIAIDGPAGSGKSTVASRLARRYNYINIETGAMYRALALKALETGISLDNEVGLCCLVRNSGIELKPELEGNRVLLDGTDVTTRIRQQDVNDAVAKVSAYPKVRVWMVRRQREMGKEGGVVMEGRDIGTHVFPNADVKVFLDADPRVRVTRRLNQNSTMEQEQSVFAELQERDQRDRTRATSPLIPAPDALLIDSSNLNLEQVVERIVEVIDAKIGK